MDKRIHQNTFQEDPFRPFGAGLDTPVSQSGRSRRRTEEMYGAGQSVDALRKSLGDKFRKQSECKGQITETMVLTEAINEWVDLVDNASIGKTLETYLREILSKRRQSLQDQLEGYEQEIIATKNAINGMSY